jgi:integrase
MARIPRFKVVDTPRGWCVNLPASMSPSGRRERHYHKTKEKALATAKKFREESREHGAQAVAIGPALADEALQCSNRLVAVGATLTDATNLFLARWAAENESLPLQEAANAWLEARATRRESTLKSYRLSLVKLDGLAEKLMAAITSAEIDKALGNGGPTAKRTHLRNVRALWRWAERKGWCDSKVVANIDAPPVPEPQDVTVLTPTQARKLLSTAEKYFPEAVPGFAVALFSGLRSSELQQITWGDIGPDGIEIASRVSKTKRRRVVPVSPTLEAWLDAYSIPNSDLSLCCANWQEKHKGIRRLAGWKVVARILDEQNISPPKLAKNANPWPTNVLRHTHASVEIALGRSLTELVFAFGHSGGTDVLQRHYFGRLSKREAIEILRIGPNGEALGTVKVA